jgi:secreted PhoX family phosphatase
MVEPTPLIEMGRFNHEAIAVDPSTGIIYQTEDVADGAFYRFIPNVPGELHKGGRLQAMKAKNRRAFDARNWDRAPEMSLGEVVEIEWVDITDVESPDDSLRYQAAEKGGIVFARGEGAWHGNDAVYFACTNGGRAQKGQIWRYVPSRFEGQADESAFPGRLQLFAEPNDGEIVDNADNITVAPWGDLIVCEDGSGEQYLRGITPDGRFYTLAKNTKGNSEFAGANFTPDGRTLFVNIQHNGLTLALRGPWQG